ncbi:hypothetical protein Scep_029554 [Stephania cephalantha]|uniref:Uncharacterized protein n=1 Tax=Stephania cephalantha TaxID=152367 RepID=A0AAP0HCB8_9MAGN
MSAPELMRAGRQRRTMASAAPARQSSTGREQGQWRISRSGDRTSGLTSNSRTAARRQRCAAITAIGHKARRRGNAAARSWHASGNAGRWHDNKAVVLRWCRRANGSGAT